VPLALDLPVATGVEIVGGRRNADWDGRQGASAGTYCLSSAARAACTRARTRVPEGRCSTVSTSPSSWMRATSLPFSYGTSAVTLTSGRGGRLDAAATVRPSGPGETTWSGSRRYTGEHIRIGDVCLIVAMISLKVTARSRPGPHAPPRLASGSPFAQSTTWRSGERLTSPASVERLSSCAADDGQTDVSVSVKSGRTG
jgi:hypothetical protein